MKKIANNQGFTLVELLIICPILMVVIAILMNFIFNQYGQLLVQNTAIDLQVQSSQIISAIKDDVEKSPALVSQLDTELIDNNAPDGGWKADNNSVLMMSIPAYTNKSDVSGVQKVLINSRGCSPSKSETKMISLITMSFSLLEEQNYTKD
jgi:type II secretory pathway pseudopilin PulG